MTCPIGGMSTGRDDMLDPTHGASIGAFGTGEQPFSKQEKKCFTCAK
jgi:hypothetical protein